MRINNLKINAYGNIENKDIELQQGINIIQGKNESGKSTLLNYILSSFYGISKNKEGKVLSDYEKYKPWNSTEFSGKIEYELDNGEKYEIFRDFNKKNPKIYNEKLEDITSKFEVDKKDGSKFFTEQTGIDKQMYLSTVVSVQEEVRLDEKDQNILIQKIANLAGTGDDNVSYKKAMEKLQDKIRDEIGTTKTTQKPINLLEKDIKEIEQRIEEIAPYRNRKYEIDNEKEEIEQKLKDLEEKKTILTEINNLTKSNDMQNKEIEIKEKNQKENLFKMQELNNKKAQLEESENELKNLIQNKEEAIKQSKNKQEDLKVQLLNLKNKKVEENQLKIKSKSTVFLAIFILLIVIGGIITILTKKYIIALIIGMVTLLDICIYVNEIKKASRHKNEKNKSMKEIDAKIDELEETSKSLEGVTIKNESDLKLQLENEKEITNNISMIKGQIILLNKSNEQIEIEINNIRDNLMKKHTEQTNQLISKYKGKINNIEDLINNEYGEDGDLEEKINQYKIMIKGLEIESNTILPQLDETITLEEKLEANNEKLIELRKREKTINITIDTLSEAYEEMKNTITPKFTQSLSSSINKISNNKYKKVTINDENGMIVENNRGEYIEASKLSTGTIDQLYLALRLSMIEDLSKEKLPIILDESFAYFDNTRLEKILKYLNEELKYHQTIIFTCTNREKEILNSINAKYNLIEL